MQAEIVQRIGPLAGVADLLRTYGVAPDELARTSGVTLQLDQLTPDDWLPLAVGLRLLSSAVALSGDELLPVKLAERYRSDQHGFIFSYIAAAPTLGHALQDFCDLQRLYGNGGVAYLHRLGDDYAFGYGLHTGTLQAVRHLYTLSAKVGENFIHDLTGGMVKPLEILFPFCEPLDRGRFRHAWRVPVYFDQGQCCLVLSGRALAMTMPGANPDLRRTLGAQIMARKGVGTTHTDRVRRLIRPQLLLEDPSMAGMAARLGLHPRTLRRALAAEGTDFETIRETVRNAIAQEMLATTQMPIGEISAILAFASHAAFVRAFQRWNQMTPSAWREQASQSAPFSP